MPHRYIALPAVGTALNVTLGSPFSMDCKSRWKYSLHKSTSSSRCSRSAREKISESRLSSKKSSKCICRFFMAWWHSPGARARSCESQGTQRTLLHEDCGIRLGSQGWPSSPRDHSTCQASGISSQISSQGFKQLIFLDSFIVSAYTGQDFYNMATYCLRTLYIAVKQC